MVWNGTEQQRLMVLNRMLTGDLTAADAANAEPRGVELAIIFSALLTRRIASTLRVSILC